MPGELPPDALLVSLVALCSSGEGCGWELVPWHSVCSQPERAQRLWTKLWVPAKSILPQSNPARGQEESVCEADPGWGQDQSKPLLWFCLLAWPRAQSCYQWMALLPLVCGWPYTLALSALEHHWPVQESLGVIKIFGIKMISTSPRASPLWSLEKVYIALRWSETHGKTLKWFIKKKKKILSKTFITEFLLRGKKRRCLSAL